MDGFTYINIFETKGIEYIIIISFLLLAIPFWMILNRKAKTAKDAEYSPDTSLSVDKLRILQGLYYSRNHAWAYLEKTGKASIGVDDLLLHITGSINIQPAKRKGDKVSKGEVIAGLYSRDKTLKILSPLSGEICDFNTSLETSPGQMNEDPYGEGWILRIKPSDWVGETSKYAIAEQAIKWTRHELERFKEFIAISLSRYSPASPQVILQDGGEVLGNPFPGLPAEAWCEFQEMFLSEVC